MKIISIDSGSLADEIGLRPGDDLRKINGHPVRDVLDFRFLIADEMVEMEVSRGDETTIFEIEKEPDDAMGIDLEPMRVRMCGNDCPFCFVDQNPAGMRPSLYFRDEDFRLSFLGGHYVTLTNISKRDLQRIAEQRLTPLFISVHAINPEVRRFLLGLRHDDRLLEKLDFLTQNRIELHAQIVVCPTHNDGAVLEETLAALSGYYPYVKTAAAVPLGLTRHREGLTQLEPVTPAYARRFIADCERHAAQFKQRLGIHFVYPSDEFYIRAGLPIPEASRYDAFDQLENGIGMVRTLLNTFAAKQAAFPTALPAPRRVTLVTGRLMGELLPAEVLPRLNAIRNLHAELVVVNNTFYGESIGVSGLLTGQDIFRQLRTSGPGDCVFLPKNCVNAENVFLDDWTVSDLAEKLAVPVQPIGNDFAPIFGAAVQNEAQV